MGYIIEICTNCGSKLEYGSNICTECGKKNKLKNNYKTVPYSVDNYNLNDDKHFSGEKRSAIIQKDLGLNPILGLIVVIIPLTSILFYFYYRKRSLRAAAHVSILGSITFSIINAILLYYVIILGG